MSLNITVTLRRRERTASSPARLVEAVAGIVDLAQPRAEVERLVELQPLDRLGGRGDCADRARHRESDQQRQQGRDRKRGAADDGAVGQPVEIAGGVLERKVLPDQPGFRAIAAQFGRRHQDSVARDLAGFGRCLPVVRHVAGSIERQEGIGGDNDADQRIAPCSGVACTRCRRDPGSTLGRGRPRRQTTM
jgi:hypothetical protein